MPASPPVMPPWMGIPCKPTWALMSWPASAGTVRQSSRVQPKRVSFTSPGVKVCVSLTTTPLASIVTVESALRMLPVNRLGLGLVVCEFWKRPKTWSVEVSFWSPRAATR